MHERSSNSQATSPPDFLQRHERLIAAVIVAAFVALAVGYSLGPALEGPDEIEHYRFVRLLAATWQLPNRLTINHEYHQPPLYYALAALIKMGVPDPDFDQIEARRSPIGIVSALLRVPNWQAQPSYGNRNLFIHSRAEMFPYSASGAARAVHLVRLLSVALGAGTLVTCYGVLRLLWPDRPGRRLIGLAVIAFWPLFDYVSGYIVNDPLLIFLSTLALFLTLRQVRDGPSLRGALVLGVVLGCALLSKVNALLLAAPVGLAILLDLRRAWRFGLVTLAAALAVGGWWYALGAIQYGDLTGLGVQYQVIPGSVMQPSEIGLAGVLLRLREIYRLLWAHFGWLNHIVVSPPIYLFFDVLTFAGVVGTAASGIRWLWRARRQSPDATWLRMAAVFAMLGLAVLASVVFFAMTYRTGAGTARYLLPAISVWASLLALGLDFWIPRRLKMPATLMGVTILAAVGAACLLVYFLPVYRPQPLPSQIEHPLAIRYENAAELIGIGASTIRAYPGEIVTVTLYWRAIQPTGHDLLTFIRTENDRLLLLMNVPATGNLRSIDWLPGQTWAEDWQVSVPPDTLPHTVYLLTVGLYDSAEQRQLIPTDDSGQTTNPPLIRLSIDSLPNSAE